MLLTSYEFILFLIICILLYYLIPKRLQWLFLLIGSYIFYFISGGIQYIVILFSTTLITYLAALFIARCNETEKSYLEINKDKISREEKKEYKAKVKSKKKAIMLIGLLVTLFLLIFFKYTNFIIDNINSIIWKIGSENEIDALDLIMPMGISFYTFQSIGYLIDVYWGKIKAERSLPKHMLFVSFFPQLIQGPISRYSDMAKSLYAEHAYEWNNIKFGLERVLWGYFKKLVVADNLSVAVMNIAGDEYYSGSWVLVGLVFYRIQLYADFSGGIDIAIGIAQIFGITLKENFVQPYFSRDISEYWRRWHITMGTWFRDYVFYPVSVSNWMNKFSKNTKERFGKKASNKIRLYIVLMITWFATGIWHGASWNFIVWGLGNGLLLCLSDSMSGLFDKFHAKCPKLINSFPYAVFQMIRTFLIMCSFAIFDIYVDVQTAVSMYASIFTDFKISSLTIQEFVDLGIGINSYIVIFIGVLIIFVADALSTKYDVREQLEKKPFVLRYTIFAALFIMIILFGAYGVGYDATQFIYNRF